MTDEQQSRLAYDCLVQAIIQFGSELQPEDVVKIGSTYYQFCMNPDVKYEDAK